MDYTKLNLKASSSPHIRSNEDVRSIMLDVIIAMVPALVAAIYFFRVPRADGHCGVCGSVCVL